MDFSRRSWLAAAAAASPLWAKTSQLRLGVTDWNLRLSGKVEAVALAKQIGFAGLEVSLGRKPIDHKLPMDNGELQSQYRAAFRQHGIVAAGTCLDVLHVNYLKSDKLGQKWVADSIAISRKLDARVILLPFFGDGALKTEIERMFVADFLKEIGKEAEKAGLTFGLENTCSAEENARILDRARSKAVRVYYDVGNSTNNGHDIFKEIPWLGSARICQFHLKDNPGFIGQGKIDFPPVLKAIMSLGFKGFANLETDSPSKSIESDMKRNLAFVRDLVKVNGPS
jgi:L-ribulose-5-phosphate 3-epimerase